ncbi:hypothetical protein ZWY2020_040476 [Hordeum vulgare]|nr:hypothetical protein ZWY2020_040476 [Hordeum vulgare]
MAILLGGDPGEPPEAVVPLYRLDGWADLMATLPVFDERGLLPPEGSSPVEVSSDDTSRGEDSEKTIDDCLASAPLLSHAFLLRELEDDDVTIKLSAVISSRLTRITRGPTSASCATRSACMLGPPKHGAESPLTHLASADGMSEAPGSTPSMGGPDAPAVPGAERKRRWVGVEE